MGTLERAAKAAAARKISRRLLLKEHKMPETTVPVSLRDAFLEDPFFRTGWDEMNSECREMRSFASKEGDNTLANMNREIKTNSRGSSRGREMVVERREERMERGRSRARDLQVPMTLRQPFLDDPFFKGTLARLENTREDFFKQARESFEESMKQMESRMSNSLTLDSQGMNDSFFPKDWMMIPPSSLNENFGSMLDRKRDCSTIKHNEDENKVEVHLDTSGYKPDELKVQVEGGIVRVEGKHEEKSEAGAVMVSRQFVKEYALPESSKPNGVESSLSKVGVLVITMPKPRKAINQDKSRSVPIAIK